jgi:hypothetical protein
MTSYDEEILALIVINHKNFANSYDLCKVLAWKFNLINCAEIIKRIEAKNYVVVTFNASKTLKSFNLTESGSALIIENNENVRTLLIKEFRSQIVFIDNLFK